MHEYVTTMVVLVGMIVGVIVVVFFLKKTMPFRFGGTRQINIIEQLALGSKERLVLLSIDREIILVGVTPHGMSTLHVCRDSKNLQPTEQDGAQNRPRL